MSVATSRQVQVAKLRTPTAEPTPSYTTANKTAWLALAEPDHMNATHTAGSVVKGRVHLWLKQTTRLTALSVHLRCKTATGLTERRGSSSTVYKWKTLLFSHTHHAVPYSRSGTELAPGAHSYAFEFTLPPSTPAPPPELAAIFPDNPAWDLRQGAPLPPSFHLVYTSHTERIVYYLEVVGARKGLLARNLRDKMPLLVTPARALPHPDPAPSRRQLAVRRQSRALDPALAPEATSLVRRLLNAGPAVDPGDPTAQFDVGAAVASVAAAGGPLQVHLALHYSAASSTAPAPPPVSLVRVHVRLNVVTVFRVPVHSFRRSAQRARKVEAKLDLVNVVLTDKPILPLDGNEPVRLESILPGLTLDPAFKPSFRSWAISRYYMLKASIVVEIVGQEYDVEIAKHHCTILPAPVSAGQGVHAQDIVASLEPDEPLPVYEPREHPVEAPPSFEPRDPTDAPPGFDQAMADAEPKVEESETRPDSAAP